MDDVWSIKAWDDLNRFFPNNRNGSRIMMTTRLKDLVGSLGCLEAYLMNFLDEDRSWNLLREKIFGQEGCSNSELEKIGKDIAKGCGGLPLAVIVIGGLLANSDMRLEYWESVAKNVKTFANSDDNNHCLKILSLSYNNLPIRLKPCFLYMRIFLEDAKISVTELIKLWVVEGFVKPVRGKTLEKIAEEYLKVLVDRNLILVRKRTRSGSFITCGIHDLLRDLCVIEFEKQHFIRVPKRQYINTLLWNSEMCVLCRGQCQGKHSSTSNDTGLVCQICESTYSDLTELRWLKVIGQPSEKCLQHTKLQDIYILSSPDSDHAPNEYEFASPSTLDLQWNLRYLFILLINNGEPIVLPSKVWEMPQLRCIDVRNAVLPDPLDIQDSIILENLSELSHLYEFKCAKEVLERIPNLKTLSLVYCNYAEDWSYYCLHNLVHLRKLESLSLFAKKLLLERIAFPTSLKKLSLEFGGIPWEDMILIGSLPNLEILNLRNNAFKGYEWSPIEGQFLRLKQLSIQGRYPVRWTAESIHFPNLESLFLDGMDNLEEIPCDIGNIATLNYINLWECKDSVINSAKQILEEQQCNGNEDILLRFDMIPNVFS